MKQQFVITIHMFIAASLLSISFSLLLSNDIANASAFTDSPSSPLLSGIISSLILGIPVESNQVNSNNNTSSSFNITNIQKFILAGDWNMRFDDMNSTSNGGELQMVGFEADFMGITKDGKGPHTHQISNFKPETIDSTKTDIEADKTTQQFNLLSKDGNASILGTADVGINGQKIWKSVNTNITVFEGKTIEIIFDDKEIDYHFGKGQAIYGLVNRLNLG